MTRFIEGEPAVLETATNTPLPYATALHPIAVTPTVVQFIPSGEYITRDELPLFATATNNPLPYVTLFQVFASAAVRNVQLIPSGEVIKRLVATATNKPLPNATLVQLFVVIELLFNTQFIPSREYAIP